MLNETLEADRAYQRDKCDAYERGFNDGYEQGVKDRAEKSWCDWIPVKEKLPPDGEKVLVCGKGGGVYTAIHNKSNNLRGWWKLNSKSHYCKPIYWMPLPMLPEELRANV